MPKKPVPEEKVHVPVPKEEPPRPKGILSDGVYMYLLNTFVCVCVSVYVCYPVH